MTYDWSRAAATPETVAWYDEQDQRSEMAHRHFATDRVPFDRLIPYPDLAGKEVLEIGVGAGLHAELMARAGARLTGIDLTSSAVDLTTTRFRLKELEGTFQQWDAEQNRPDFRRRFDFVWSWGVIHHSAHTARIVRNVAGWLTAGGTFGGMVYHRDSTPLVVALARQWALRRNFQYSVDEALWRNTDGFSARFYPADQWRDLLLAFFEAASVSVTGIDSDLPIPRPIRQYVVSRLSDDEKRRFLARCGHFVAFRAATPITE